MVKTFDEYMEFIGKKLSTLRVGEGVQVPFPNISEARRCCSFYQSKNYEVESVVETLEDKSQFSVRIFNPLGGNQDA